MSSSLQIESLFSLKTEQNRSHLEALLGAARVGTLRSELLFTFQGSEDLLFESLLSSQKLDSMQLEALQDIRQVGTLPLESLLLLQIIADGRMPVEWAGALQVSGASRMPVELLLEVQGLGKSALESLSDFSSPSSLLLETLAGLSSDSTVPIELNSLVLNASALPFEFGGDVLIVSRNSLPVEFLSTVGSNHKLPSEWAGSTLASSVSALPVEWLYNSATEHQLHVESKLTFLKAGKLAFEWVKLNSIDQRAPIEWVFATNKKAILPIEWTGTASIDITSKLPIEWQLETSSKGQFLGITWTQEARRVTRLPVETRISNSSVNRLLFESQKDIQKVQASPVEWLIGELGISRELSVELLLEARRRAPLPVEWAGLKIFVEGNPFVIDELVARSFVISRE